MTGNARGPRVTGNARDPDVTGNAASAHVTRLAVFDCDGTLVDSQVNIIRAMRESFARVGVAAPDDHAIRHVVGLSLFETM